MRLLLWILIAVCVAFMIRRLFIYFVRMSVQHELRTRSWGTDWAGGCFEVLQTNRKGCRESYKDDTQVTLNVR